MDIATGLGIAKTSLELIRGIREALRKKTLSNDEILAYFSDLQDRIVDIKSALADADEENRKLKRQIEELKSNALVFPDGNARWEKLPDGSHYGPLCDACWGFKQSRIKLHLDSTRTGPDYRIYLCKHHPSQVAVKIPVEVLAKYGIDS